MKQEEVWRDFKSLPSQAQREVMDFIAFLRIRYKLPCPGDKIRKKELADEPFVGMWRNREDVQNSSTWVRNIRKREWTKS